MSNSDLTIGLTLSGGGARGAAHIGVLKALLEAGVVPNRLVGVSSGAIVATLYATGMAPDEMLKFVLESSMLRVIKLGIPLTGLTSLDYLKERLAIIWPDNSFEGLKYPLHIGVTNLNTAKQELVNTGPLHDILAASCSIPFVFKPVEIDGYKYVDGGVIRNMPVEPLLHDTDFIIGSNLMPYGLLPPANINTVIDVVWRTFELSIMSNTIPGMDVCDIIIEPSMLNDCNIFNFTRLQDMHDLGYEHTCARMPEILNAIQLKRELLEAL
ncbi:patatin-like phospholipase family protein [Neolewinella aurantiaca]|uniref:patatin-like phospholipase family protein n=1 Tax=Neolewinella aurantiaca TaxID=2602767 RepID=UPI0016508A16|nr:patatin-like phospholipase family protein [Neolewinella aurantiaca]